MRRSHFRVGGRFEGAHAATVTIEIDGANAVVLVTPLRSRRSYVARLEDVAKWIIFEDVKRRRPELARALRPRRVRGAA